MKTAVGDGELALGSLMAVLERIAEPTFIVREDGWVRFANASGRARLSEDPTGVAAEICSTVTSSPPAGRLVCTALTVAGWFLVSATLREPTRCRVERARVQFGLTRRQIEVVDLLIGGATNQTIARLLGITRRTVEVHLSAIYDRAGVENRTSLVSIVLAA